MDPEQALYDIVQMIKNGQFGDAKYAIDDLREWVKKGGYLPTGYPGL